MADLGPDSGQVMVLSGPVTKSLINLREQVFMEHVLKIGLCDF